MMPDQLGPFNPLNGQENDTKGRSCAQKLATAIEISVLVIV